MCQSASFAVRSLLEIDNDEEWAGAVAACFLDLRPEMDAVAMNVRAPGDDQPCAMKLLSIRAELAAVDREDGVAAGGGADGAIELGGAQPMEESAVHGAVAEHADGAGVGIGQDGFGAVLFRYRGKPLRDGVQRLIPGRCARSFPLHARRAGGPWRHRRGGALGKAAGPAK